jgi:hypothetical protein
MNTLQLYINGERVELFEDESINVTSSIQNSKDISKIFTDFSKDFTVPATSKNNKIFKHYYNYDIVDGFDARIRQEALLQINHFDFRKGKVSLMGVSMKNNSPSSYKIVFYGSTVTLPDLFGDDVLPDVLELNRYNHAYSDSEVKQGLRTSLSDGNVIYPLLTHTKRLYYDSTGTTTNDGNLYFDATKPNRGLDYKDLKPAIKLKAIVNSIGEKYGLTFSSTFFESIVFDRLFMWLHRKKGAMTVTDGITQTSIIKNFERTSGSELVAQYINDVFLISRQDDFGGTEYRIFGTLTINPYSEKTYSIYVYNKGLLIKSVVNTNGVLNLDISPQLDDYNEIKTVIETSNGLSNYDAKWVFESIARTEDFQGNQSGFGESTVTYEALNASLIDEVQITDHIPNMKVLDFMTNLFKMFNLTSYVEDDGSIYVDNLDTFYSEYVVHDLTNYVFSESSTIDRALPYNKINLEFPESKTFIAQKTNQIFGNKSQFGNLIYDGGEKYDGTEYSLKVDFEKMVYERLTDAGSETNQLTAIGYGWFTEYKGDSAEDILNASPALNKPLIFFNVKTDSSTSPISWTSGGHSQINTYNRPSNVSNQDSNYPTSVEYSLNFGIEVDEYALTTNTNTLYEIYYKQYIQRVFNPKGRMFTFKAKLPNKFILKYKLNDVIIVNSKQYIINSIDTELMTGISTIQLINKLNDSVATNNNNVESEGLIIDAELIS